MVTASYYITSKIDYEICTEGLKKNDFVWAFLLGKFFTGGRLVVIIKIRLDRYPVYISGLLHQRFAWVHTDCERPIREFFGHYTLAHWQPSLGNHWHRIPQQWRMCKFNFQGVLSPQHKPISIHTQPKPDQPQPKYYN